MRRVIQEIGQWKIAGSAIDIDLFGLVASVILAVALVPLGIQLISGFDTPCTEVQRAHTSAGVAVKRVEMSNRRVTCRASPR